MLNLIVPLFLVRLLTPEAIGQYKIFFLYLVLVPWFFLTAGIPNGLSYWAGHDEKRLSAFRTSWTFLVLIATVVLALGIVAYPGLRLWLDWNPFHLRLFIVSAFVQCLSTFFEEAAIAQGMIWRGALFTSGFDLARNMGMLGAALYFKNIEAVFWANFVVVGSKVALGWAIGYKEGTQRLEFSPEMRQAVVKYALPVSFSAALGIITTYNDQLILSSMIPAADFAMYSLGCLTVPPLLIIETAINRVLIPRMSRAFATNKPAEARLLLREATSELTWLFLPSTVGLVLFARPIVLLLFTAKFIGATIFLRISAFKYLQLALPFDPVARARGNGKWILRQLIVFSVVSIGLVIALTKAIGAAGAILGLLTAQYLMRFSSMKNIKATEG
ncbi:MAG: lipopolysaccharide biosynthesis protein, partial [Deltaproteobacteria bacterium]|nr:lipopolysaccharide biosynthesis protein [Deltaproteobacteria bacterium]